MTSKLFIASRYCLLGALSALAIAWLLSLTYFARPVIGWLCDPPAVDHFHGAGPADDRWSVQRKQYPVGYTVMVLKNWKAGYADERPVVRKDDAAGLPSWSLAKRSAAEYERGANVVEYAAGFPMVSFHARWETESGFDPAGAHARGGIPVRIASEAAYPVMLPFRPLWGPFAINAVFWAVALHVVMRYTRGRYAGFRRWRNGRGGCCPRCAYDVRDQEVCPECGEASIREATVRA